MRIKMKRSEDFVEERNPKQPLREKQIRQENSSTHNHESSSQFSFETHQHVRRIEERIKFETQE